MKAALRYIKGIAAAAGAGTLLLLVLLSLPQGPSIFGFGELVGLLVAITIASVLIGVPTLLILAKVAALRLSTVSVTWALASAVLVGGFLSLTPKDDWFFGGATLVEIVWFSAAAAAVGAVCGLACWFAMRDAPAS